MTVVYSPTQTVGDPSFQGTLGAVERRLRADSAVSTVVPPRPGVSISPDGHTAIVQAGAARDSNAMVRAADQLKGPLAGLGRGGVQVHLTGASGMWSDFNAANKSAMLRSEVISWPVTLAIMLARLRLPRRRGPAADADHGRPGRGRRLALPEHQGAAVSIWAMNFALMFALALGIDYALFVVHRFRGAFFGSRLPPAEAVGQTMDTAGKAVLFSGVTVLISLSAVMLVPEPRLPLDEPRDHAGRDLRPRRDPDPAAGGAGEARAQGRRPLAALGAFGRAPLATLRRLGRAYLAPATRLRHPRARRCSWCWLSR